MLLLAVTEEDLSPYSHDLMVQVDGKTKMKEQNMVGPLKTGTTMSSTGKRYNITCKRG